MYIYTYYSIKILDKKVSTLKEIPRSTPVSILCFCLCLFLFFSLSVPLCLSQPHFHVNIYKIYYKNCCITSYSYMEGSGQDFAVAA